MVYKKRHLAKKEVNSTPLGEKVYFSIIEYVRLNNKLPTMGMSKQARNKYITKLKRSGILIKLGYATWGIDNDKVEQLKFIDKVVRKKEVNLTLKGSTQRLAKKFTSLKDKRGHGFIITFEIPRIAGWYKREEFFKKQKIEYKKVGIRGSGVRIVIKDHKIQLYKKSIVIYTPSHLSYFSETAKESYKYAIYDIQQILKRVENLLQVSFKIDGTYKFKVSRQHYGKVNDSIANMYKRNGERLYVANNKGVWLITDNSLNMSETETVNKETAQTDMDKVIVPFLNGLKEHYEKTGEAFTVTALMQMQYTQFKTQQQTGRNIEEIAETLRKITKKIGE